MTYHGRIQNGVVVLDVETTLPDGTRVRVEPLELADDADVPTLYDQLRPLVGSVKDLPPDMAANHDHYLHGRPKK